MYDNFKRNKFLTQYKPIYGKGFVDCKTKDKNGNTFQISKEDPRWISGELVGVSKGKKWISNYKDKINKCIDINLLEEYLNMGWQLGRYK